MKVPPEWYTWTKTFSWIQLDLLDIIPAACIGDYEYRLKVQALLPVGAAGAVWCISLIQIVRGRLLGRSFHVSLLQVLRKATFLALPWVSLIIFIALPHISTIIFHSFDCKDWGTDLLDRNWHYLSADRSMLCSIGDEKVSEYESLQAVAIGFIFTWPVLVLSTLLALLLKQRSVLISHRSTSLSKALNFLHCEYDPHFCFFEVVDMARRIALTGGVLLIPTNKSMLRLLAALLITLGYQSFLLGCAPYRRRDNFTFAVASQVLLLCVLVLAMVRLCQNPLKRPRRSVSPRHPERDGDQLWGLWDAYGSMHTKANVAHPPLEGVGCTAVQRHPPCALAGHQGAHGHRRGPWRGQCSRAHWRFRSFQILSHHIWLLLCHYRFAVCIHGMVGCAVSLGTAQACGQGRV